MDLEGAEEAAPADKPAGKPAAQPKAEAKPEKALDVKGETKLGMQHTKAGDFPKWYQEVIMKAEMIEFYDISGCYILRPWSYYIWECIQHWFDSQIKESGVQNCYFPCFVSAAKLKRRRIMWKGLSLKLLGSPDLENLS